MATPGITSFTMSDSIRPNTPRRVDPSAIRTAISRVRVATMNPTTPTIPSAARISTTAGESHGDGLRNQIAQALVDEVLSGDDAGEGHTGQHLNAQLAEHILKGFRRGSG